MLRDFLDEFSKYIVITNIEICSLLVCSYVHIACTRETTSEFQLHGCEETVKVKLLL